MSLGFGPQIGCSPRWVLVADVKHEAMANGQTRQGYLPVVTLNGRDLTECHALMRRFSKQLGE